VIHGVTQLSEHPKILVLFFRLYVLKNPSLLSIFSQYNKCHALVMAIHTGVNVNVFTYLGRNILLFFGWLLKF